MKLLTSLIVTFVSTQIFAATVELGKYAAYPVDYPSAIATIELKADFSAGVSIDIDGLIVNCVGTYKVEENMMSSHVFCDHDQAPEVNVNIDFTNVTPEGLRSEAGVEVPAQFDLLGDETVLFNLKKAD
jgi:hypothetical protein